MAIKVKCAQCQQGFTAPPTLAGKRVACPKCKAPISIPQENFADPPAAPFVAKQAAKPAPVKAGPPPRPNAPTSPAAASEAQPARRGKELLWIGLAVGTLVLAVVGVGGYFKFFAKDGTQVAKNGPNATNATTPDQTAPVNPTGASTNGSRKSYQERRTALQTNLWRKGPSPQKWSSEKPPANVAEMTYPSGDLQLKAWVFSPDGAKDHPAPALVFFHGGFGFGADDMAECKPFMDAGFVVMCPMLRGENGNPGNFELFYGEIDDAKAAVNWLATQPTVIKERIYTFGHSVGGGISALLSLEDDVPIRHGGSAGGIYGTMELLNWKDVIRFDVSNPEEINLRAFIGNAADMRRKHFAYIGRTDLLGASMQFTLAEDSEFKKQPLLTVVRLPGNHFTSLQPAVHEYLKLIQDEEGNKN